MYRGINLIPADTRIPFIAWRRVFFLFSLTLVLGSAVLFAVRGLNYGVDFVGGILIEIRTEGPPDIAEMRQRLGGLGLGEVTLQEFGEANDVLIRFPIQEGAEEAQQQAIDAARAALGENVDYRRIELVGPAVSRELFRDGIYAIAAALFAMLVYIWFRFEWQFGLAAVVALFHDIISTIGLFALLRMEFNLATVAAILTIAGYSINDSVVVFDRVRENLRKYKTMPLPKLFDLSINETLARTTITGLSTLLAVLALYVLGGDVIRGFSLAMLWGIVIGTYSSICLAVPLMLYMYVRPAPVAGETASKTSTGKAS
ncbi:MAG: protein translocase subunit SecF [Hyphomicrobium sp.]